MPKARLLVALLAVSSMCAVVVGACSEEPSFIDDSIGASGTGGGGGAVASASGGGIAGSGQGGMGTECTKAIDCAGEDSECASRSCTNGFCGMSFKPAGFAVAVQTQGDCMKNACDGNGAVAPQTDDNDVPNDGSDCTTDLCNAGVPSHGNAPANTPCGVDLKCDGMGSCTGCTMPSQCGQDTDCLVWVCSMSMTCVPVFVVDGGGQPAGQTPNDCKKIVCNGNGGTKVIEDPADSKPDGNLCTSDFCSGGIPSYAPIPPQDDFNLCTDDVCDPGTGNTNHPPVGNGMSCGGCSTCQAGQCTSSCTGCDFCNGSSCVSSCSNCETCQGSQCQSTCPNCEACVNGQCQGGCAPCQTCPNNTCVGACGSCETCNGTSCTNNCGPCDVCQGGQCVSQCGPCQTCQGGSCVNTCQPCEACQGGSCVPNCGPCEACDVSGNCATTCTGPCETCNGNICQINPDPCCANPNPCCLNSKLLIICP